MRYPAQPSRNSMIGAINTVEDTNICDMGCPIVFSILSFRSRCGGILLHKTAGDLLPYLAPSLFWGTGRVHAPSRWFWENGIPSSQTRFPFPATSILLLVVFVPSRSQRSQSSRVLSHPVPSSPIPFSRKTACWIRNNNTRCYALGCKPFPMWLHQQRRPYTVEKAHRSTYLRTVLPTTHFSLSVAP